MILIQDNASYHKQKSVCEWFEKNKDWITVFNLPPYSPEFNAVEGIWKYTRKEGTHNKYFESKESIIKALKRVFLGIQRWPHKIEGYIKPFAKGIYV